MTFIPHSCNLPLEQSGSLLANIRFKFLYNFSPTIFLYNFPFAISRALISQANCKISDNLLDKFKRNLHFGGGGSQHLFELCRWIFYFNFNGSLRKKKNKKKKGKTSKTSTSLKSNNNCCAIYLYLIELLLSSLLPFFSATATATASASALFVFSERVS